MHCPLQRGGDATRRRHAAERRWVRARDPYLLPKQTAHAEQMAAGRLWIIQVSRAVELSRPGPTLTSSLFSSSMALALGDGTRPHEVAAARAEGRDS
jgi:hypothetical protein